MVVVRARFVVDGVVQKPGYKDFVGSVARDLGVRGLVEDLEDGTVGVIAEAEELVLEEFRRRIDARPGVIVVRPVWRVNVSAETGEYSSFVVGHGLLGEEILEKLSEVARIAGRLATGAELEAGFGKLFRDVQELKRGIDRIGIYSEERRGMIEPEFSELRSDVERILAEMTRFADILLSVSKEIDMTRQELTQTTQDLLKAIDGLAKLVQELVEGSKKGSET